MLRFLSSPALAVLDKGAVVEMSYVRMGDQYRNLCSSAKANKSSKQMKMKFVADHCELVLLDFVHIPPSGVNFFQSALLWICSGEGKQDDEMDTENLLLQLPSTLLLCASFGISHRIPQILMTPVKMNITCHQIPCRAI